MTAWEFLTIHHAAIEQGAGWALIAAAFVLSAWCVAKAARWI